MSMQTTETVDLGDIKVSNHRATVFSVKNIGTSIAVVIYDVQNKIGGIAHIILPESTLTNTYAEQIPGKYADTAIPQLLADFTTAGGQKRTSVIRLIGGAQLFNFGGGGSNILNIGARNVNAIQAALSKQGMAIEKSDVGGNKGRSLRFVLTTGQVMIEQSGARSYTL